jgi:hypothetical protein
MVQDSGMSYGCRSKLEDGTPVPAKTQEDRDEQVWRAFGDGRAVTRAAYEEMLQLLANRQFPFRQRETVNCWEESGTQE